MYLRRSIASLVALAALTAHVSAATLTLTIPNTVNQNGQPVSVEKVFIIDPATGLPSTGGGGGGGGGDASAANQTAVQANPGTDSSKATAVQGVTGGKALSVSQSGTWNMNIATLPALAAGSNNIGSIANITGTITLPTGASTSANQAAAQSSFNTLVSNTTGLATATGQSAGNTSLGSIVSEIGALSSPATGSTNYLLGQIVTGLSDTSASFVKIDHTTPGTTDAVVITSSALPTGASTSTAQTAAQVSLSSIDSKLTANNAAIGAPASTAPASAQYVGGVGPSGNLRGILVSTSGGLLPGQAAPASTRTTLTASTATQIDAGRTGRLLSTIQFDGSPGAAVYLCFTQTTTCSATTYDIKVASGAADATTYTAPFGSTAAIYAYTTGTGVIINVASWLAL